MTDHLPECDWLEDCLRPEGHEAANHSTAPGSACYHCGNYCNCDKLLACENRVLSMRFTEFMALIKERCPCICHEQTSGINAHNDKCLCNGGTGMETL